MKSTTSLTSRASAGTSNLRSNPDGSRAASGDSGADQHLEAAGGAAPPVNETAIPIRWLVLAGVWFVYFCFGLTTVGLAPLVGPITRDLGLSHSAMGTVLGMWQFVYIAAAVPCGALLDRLGPRRALFIGALIIAASSAMRGVAVDFWTLCFAVGLFGLGGPIVSAGAPKVVSEWFRGRERGLAMGIYITGPAIGSIVALALTNAVLMPWMDQDWRRVLQLWGVVAFAGALVWIAIASQPAVRVREMAAVAAERKPQWNASLLLLKLPAVRVLLLMSVGIFTINHGLNSWLPELLRLGGMSAIDAGYWATIPTAVGVAGSLLIPRLATPERRLRILGAMTVLAGLGTILLQASPGALLAGGLIAQGLARGTLLTLAMLTLVETRGVGERHAGAAGGLFFSAAEIGGAGGPIVLGALYDATGSFVAGLWLLTSIAALLLVGVARLRALTPAEGQPDTTTPRANLTQR